MEAGETRCAPAEGERLVLKGASHSCGSPGAEPVRLLATRKIDPACSKPVS